MVLVCSRCTLRSMALMTLVVTPLMTSSICPSAGFIQKDRQQKAIINSFFFMIYYTFNDWPIRLILQLMQLILSECCRISLCIPALLVYRIARWNRQNILRGRVHSDRLSLTGCPAQYRLPGISGWDHWLC